MLSIVATPIGNLADITLRAVTVLSNADLILAEDTRVTRALLDHYNIKTPLMAYHQHSSDREVAKFIEQLRAGKNIALVSDAGTPGVNDPGSYLVRQALQELPDLKVVPIPGANAAVSALSVSGFPSDHFLFMGFPPHKKGRKTFFEKVGATEETVVFYESKHRIEKALVELQSIAMIGERPLMVARELTKQFETIYRGTVQKIQHEMQMNKNSTLGEFVVVIGPKLKYISNEDQDEE